MVGEDHVRFGADLDTVLPAPLDRLGDVGDPQIDQGGRGLPIEQQPDPADHEEQQTRRVEEAGRLCPEQPRVEPAGPIEILGMLRDLEQIHVRSVPHYLVPMQTRSEDRTIDGRQVVSPDPSTMGRGLGW